MSDPLLGVLERLPPRVRRLTVAVGGLLLLGAVMAALTLSSPRGGHQRRPARQRPVGGSLPHTSPGRVPPPVSTGQLFVARRAAERFLAGYLRFAYGRGDALAIRGVTPALRRQLRRQRAQLTPVERGRRPQAVSLQTIGTTPTFVVATAVIDDGGVTTYRLRFTLQAGGGRWAVISVDEG
jgi:hypothetical protein